LPHLLLSQQSVPIANVSSWGFTPDHDGFGDILPAHPDRALATAGEVLTRQLYLAVLIGRLVGMQISSGPAAKDDTQ